MVQSKKDLMILVDSPGWAYDHKANALAKNLTGFDTEIRYHEEFTNAAKGNKGKELQKYDVALFLGFFYYPIYFPESRSFNFSDNMKWPWGAMQSSDLSNVVATLTSWQFLHSGWPNVPETARSYRRAGAVSPSLWGKLKDWGAESPTLCMNGVDENKFCPEGTLGRTSKKLRVGWVGSIRNKSSGHAIDFKGYDVVLKKVIDHFSDADIEFVVHRVDSMKTDSLKSQDEMREFYNSLDVYLSTSHEYSEGTPNPAFEASACGIPVVSTVNGCIEELITHEENGFIASGWQTEKEADLSVKEICAYLSKLANSEDLAPEMGQAARLEIENNWTWSQRSIDYLHLFKGVTDGGE